MTCGRSHLLVSTVTQITRRKGQKEKDTAQGTKGLSRMGRGTRGKDGESRSPRKGEERSRESPFRKPGLLLVSAVSQCDGSRSLHFHLYQVDEDTEVSNCHVPVEELLFMNLQTAKYTSTSESSQEHLLLYSY